MSHVIEKTLIKTIWIILRNEEIEKRKIILRRNASEIFGESNLVCIDLGTDSLKTSGVGISHEIKNSESYNMRHILKHE